MSTLAAHRLWVLTLLKKQGSVFHWAISHFKSCYYSTWRQSISGHHPIFITSFHINVGKEMSKGWCIWQFDWLHWVQLGLVMSSVVPRPLWVLTLLTKENSAFYWAIPRFNSCSYSSWIPSISGHHPIFITSFHIDARKETHKAIWLVALS